MLDDAIRDCANRSVLCWLATVDENGHPNVSPKEIFTIHDSQTLLIAEIASPLSARNVAYQSHVCVSFIDIFRQKGFKLSGTAQLLLPDHPEFLSKSVELVRIAGPHFKIRGVFDIAVTRVHRIIAPSYTIFPDQTEEQSVEGAYRTYGVQPKTAM